MAQPTEGPLVEVFTLPMDPESSALIEWLDAQGIAYNRRNLGDPETAREAVARTGLRIGPVTLVDGRPVRGKAAEQKRRLQSLLWRDLQS